MSIPPSPSLTSWKKFFTRTALLLVVGILAFGWGALTVKNKLFPYDILNVTYNKISGAGDAGKRSELNKLWVKKIISGGYILHLRHAHRENWAEVHAFDAYELREHIEAESASFSKATCLSPRGVEEAKLIGNIFSH